MRLSFILLLLSACCFTSWSQKSAEEIIDEFFRIYEEKPVKAVDYIFGTNPWVKSNLDAVENVRSQLDGTLKLVGDYYGFEKITEKSVGENMKLISYMVKYDRQPLRFTFILYRPDEEWKIQNFQFDDSLAAELEEAAKLHRLSENR